MARRAPVLVTPPLAKRVLLIGWDAADWKVIHPLMDAGKMPALNRLVAEGAMANLATLHPVLSPMLWTSIATGKRPFKHGVLGFSEPSPDGRGVRPVSNLSRKVRAIWNILNQTGHRCVVVGWWPSHPAEPLNGVMVSDHYHRAVGPLDQPWPLLPRSVHPPELAAQLADLRVHPNELGAAHILPFVPRAAEIDQSRDRRLAAVAKILAECTTIHAAATWLMEHESWDFMAVYYDAIDHFSHGFMKYYPPRQAFIAEREFELYQGVVEAGYRYHDLMLGRLLELAGDDTTVLLVSDHGFQPDHLRPQSIPVEPAGPAVEHRDFGIFLVKGPGVKPDEHLHGLSLLDVTPTILTLFGLPVGEDMDGRPVVEAFETPPPLATIASWEAVDGADGRHPPDAQLDPVTSQEAMAHLIALGYIEPLDPNRQRAISTTVRELRYNLARAYMDADFHGQAAPILEALYAADPSEYRFGIQLAMCYRALERIADLRQLVERMNARRGEDVREARSKLRPLVAELKQRHDAKARAEEAQGEVTAEISPTEQQELRRLLALANLKPFAFEYLMGFVNAAEGRHEAALEHLARAEQADASRPGLHLQIGEAYLRLKRWEEAERAFAKAAAIDPHNPHAHLGLCRTSLARRRNRRATAEALSTVGLLYQYPLAHFYLGVGLQRLGELANAAQAFQVAVTLNPNFLEAHLRLAGLYEGRLRDPERGLIHRRLAAEIREARRRTGGRAVLGSLAPPQTDLARVEDEPASAVPPQAATEPVERLDGGAAPRRREAAAPKPLARPLVTVVTGLPRSGTSMLMKMLADGGMPVLTDGVRAADADNPHGYFEYEGAKRLRNDTRWLSAASGKVVKIVAQLVPYLPPDYAYRVIVIERDLREVVASQAAMLARRGRTGASLATHQLRDAFVAHLRRVKRWLATQEHMETLCVNYRDMLADPPAGAAALNRFLGGRLDTDAMASAVDGALYRQRQGCGEPA